MNKMWIGVLIKENADEISVSLSFKTFNNLFWYELKVINEETLFIA